MERLKLINYDKATQHLKKYQDNVLFALAVSTHKCKGIIYTDSNERPQIFYIVSEYGMSWLCGKADNQNFNSQLLTYLKESDEAKKQWIQAPNKDWWDLLTKFAKELDVCIDNRVNFYFDKNNFKSIDTNYEFQELNENDFNSLDGLVTPNHFWNDYSLFQKYSKGFKLIVDQEIVAIAFGAYTDTHHLEIGIETFQPYQKKGYAKLVASKLIEYCLENNLTPMWSCRLQNTGSYALAQKVGFQLSTITPYYNFKK